MDWPGRGNKGQEAPTPAAPVPLPEEKPTATPHSLPNTASNPDFPYPAPSQREQAQAMAFGGASTRFLIATFLLIFLMSVTGLILSAFFGTDDDIFHDAIRIVGIGGPASAVGNSASNAIARWRAGPEGQK